MLATQRLAPALLSLVFVATGALAGPVTSAVTLPTPAPSGWSNTNVLVQVSMSRYRGTPSVIYEITGAQKSKATTLPGSNVLIPITVEGTSSVFHTGVDASGPSGQRKHVVMLDKTAPRSTLAFGLDQSAQRYVAAVIARDPVPPSGTNSGMKEIRFTLDGGPDTVVHSDVGSLVLPLTGWSMLIVRAIDNAGNEEYPPQTITRDPGLVIAPPRLEFSTPIGQIGVANVQLVQTNPLFPAQILSVASDHPYFWAAPGACTGPNVGVVACSLPVYYYAADTLERDATLFVTTDDPLQAVYTAQLHGRGTLPGLAFTPDPVEFPLTSVGSTSAPVSVTLTNDGQAPLAISKLSTGSVAFLTVGDRCTGATLLAMQSCSVDIAFAPLGYGPHAGALEVQSNLPGAPRFVPFEAFGVVTATLTSLPAAWNFGMVLAGGNEKMSFKIRNIGPVPFALQDFSIAGPGAAMYQVVDAFCQNGAPPTTIEPQQTCSVTVLFMPTMGGAHDAVLRAGPSLGQAAFDVPLTGVAP